MATTPPSANGPQVRWDTVRRQVLCCLYRFFSCSQDEFTTIFSAIFEVDLVDRGFPKGVVPYRTLRSQWIWMRNKDHPVWKHVHIQTPFSRDAEWKQTISLIQAAAQRRQVSLTKKVQDDINNAPVQVSSMSSVAMDQSIPSQIAVVQEILLTVSPKDDCFWCFRESSENVLNAGRTTLGHTKNEELPAQCFDDFPPLLYRWSNIDSQGVNSRTILRAGVFADTGKEFFWPDQVSRADFDKCVENHLRKQKVKTPFISTFSSLLAPIHRGLHFGEGAVVSVIDPRKIDMPIFSAKELVLALNLEFSIYDGRNEYLVWGQVPTPAIVSTFKISTLESIACSSQNIHDLLQLAIIKEFPRSSNPRLHERLRCTERSRYEISLILGKLVDLLGIPDNYKEDVVRRFAQCWSKWTSIDPKSDFNKGLRNRATGKCFKNPMAEGCDSHVNQLKRPNVRKTTQFYASGSEYQPSGSDESGFESNEANEHEYSPTLSPFDSETTSEDGYAVHDTPSVCSELEAALNEITRAQIKQLSRTPIQPMQREPTTRDQFCGHLFYNTPISPPQAHGQVDADNSDPSVLNALQRDWPSEYEESELDTPTKRAPGPRTFSFFQSHLVRDMDIDMDDC